MNFPAEEIKREKPFKMADEDHPEVEPEDIEDLAGEVLEHFNGEHNPGDPEDIERDLKNLRSLEEKVNEGATTGAEK